MWALRASPPRSNAGIVFGEETRICLWKEGGGQVGERGKDSHRRRENGERDRGIDSRGHLTKALA